MNSNKIQTFDYLQEFQRIHVKITGHLFLKIKTLIKKRYRSLYRYSKFLQVNYGTLKSEFKDNIYHPFHRLLAIVNDANISKDEVYANIEGFYHWGSHRDTPAKVPRYLVIDEFFVEGYALYLAEGDNGANGNQRPRKFRFTNSEPVVINHMILWLNTYFPNNHFHIDVINRRGKTINHEEIKKLINHPSLRFTEEDYNNKVKYKLCLNSAIIIDLFLVVEETIKTLCAQDRKLAAAYIRGMMIGEGTAYFNRARYVRIEMRNEKEIKYLHYLLTMLGYNCTPSLRTTRQDMWSLYIGAKQLEKFAAEIGFGVHQKRQEILKHAASKVLRVNQYC